MSVIGIFRQLSAFSGPLRAKVLELFGAKSRISSQMRRGRVLRLSVLFFLGYLSLSFVAGVFVAEGTLHPGRRLLSTDDATQAEGMAHSHDSELADVAVTAGDGATLRGWSIRPRHSNGKAVILLHGLGDNRLGMIGYAELLLSHRFNVLMADARAHGASDGALATYGLLESQDIHHWFDWLQENQQPDCIFGFGESMGAAQLLQSLRDESRFCAVAAESPFSSFREIAYDRVGQFFHTGPWLGRTIFRPVVEAAFGYARWKYKVNFEHVSPERIVAATSVPVLLIHGRNDSNIPIRHSRRIAADNPTLTFWEVPATDHCGAISTSRREFEQRLIRWFDDHPLEHEGKRLRFRLGSRFGIAGETRDFFNTHRRLHSVESRALTHLESIGVGNVTFISMGGPQAHGNS